MNSDGSHTVATTHSLRSVADLTAADIAAVLPSSNLGLRP